MTRHLFGSGPAPLAGMCGVSITPVGVTMRKACTISSMCVGPVAKWPVHVAHVSTCRTHPKNLAHGKAYLLPVSPPSRPPC